MSSLVCTSRHLLRAYGAQQPKRLATTTTTALQMRRSFSTSSNLPIIDISVFVNEGPMEQKLQVAQQLREVCSKVGFLYIKGHGVHPELIEQMIKVARHFFQLGPNEKQLLAMNADSQGIGRGYQLLGENVTQGKRDHHEAIDFIRQLPTTHNLVLESTSPFSKWRSMRPLIAGVNRVPHKPPTFAPTMNAYVHEMLRVGSCLMRGMALSLDLPEHYFIKSRLTDDGFWLFRVINYPPLENNETLSCGEHTDYGCLTILHQDSKNPAALQVKGAGSSDEWIPAQPVEGCFLVNLGDTWGTWTRGFYKSTSHRVIHEGPGDRISVPFFYEPNFDAEIEPIEEANVEPKINDPAPFIYGQHLMQKIETNFNFKPQ